MLAHDVIFRSPPISPWLGTLRRQLGNGGANAVPERLEPISALTELRYIAESMLDGRSGPQAKADRQSLSDDLEGALVALGASTTAAAQPALASFRARLAELPNRLKKAEASAMAAEVRSLLETLQDPAVVQGAWDDTVGTFRSETTTTQQGELRMLQLRELLEWRQHGWGQVTDTLAAIISDSRDMALKYGLTEAELEAGDEFAGKSEDGRLGYCNWYAGQEPEPVNIAVWLLLTGAALPSGQLELGPVTLFDGQLVSVPLGTENRRAPTCRSFTT